MVKESSLQFPATSDWEDYQELEIEVQLVEGDNSVRLSSIGYGGGKFASLIVKGKLLLPAVTTVIHSETRLKGVSDHHGNEDCAAVGSGGSEVADFHCKNEEKPVLCVKRK